MSTASDAPGEAPRQPGRSSERLLLAMMLVVGSTVFFAGGDVGAKLMKQTAPAQLATWFRYLVLFLVAVPWALTAKGFSAFRPSSFSLQIGRGLAAVHFISPIIVMVLSIFILGEQVGIRRWLSAVVGFVGVLLIVRPGADSFQLAALLPLGSATAWALGALFTRLMRSEPTEVTFMWTGIIGLAVSSLLVLPVFRMPTGPELAYGIGGSLSFTLAHMLFISGLKLAPLSLLAPITYVQLVSAGVLSYLFFGNLPSYYTLIGSALIAGSGLYSAHRERVRQRIPAMPLPPAQ
jgi:drug/metabolite transporter (DMT)-like permease